MKSRVEQLKNRVMRLAIGAVLAAWSSHPTIAQDAAAEPVRIPSVFEDGNLPGHTDPFFPRTQRLAGNRKAVDTMVAAPVAVQAVAIDQIRLQGVSLGQEKTVLINNKTLAEGESTTLKLAKGVAQVQIQVLEVRPRSAVIKIEGDPEPKEIYLRPF